MNSFIPRLFYFATSTTSSGPTAEDIKNADALGKAEKRRNEILTERLDLERQLYKFESDITKQISKRIQLDATVRENLNATKDIEKNILKNKQTAAVIQNRINNLGNDATKQAAAEISNLKKQIDATTDLGKQEEYYAKLRELSNIEGAYQLSILNDQLDVLKEENKEFSDILEESKKLDRGIFNITGNIAAALPGLGKFSQTFKDAAMESRKAGGGMAGFVAGTKKIVDLAPEAVFIMLAKSIMGANSETAALGKQLGVSYGEARKLRQEYASYSASVNDSFITTTKLVKAQAELSSALGIAVNFSGQELATFSKLTEIVGLTADEAGKLSQFSAATGLTNTQYVADLRKSAFYAQQANKIHISDKQLLQDVSKLSAGILTKFENNPKALAAAVVQAKALGLTLEQVDKVGESLLNWESSIENELKAELLTGKQINLEKARAAALTGDQATLMQEVASQAGSLADFQGMNVLAQKSLAEAFGMSRDEMADMLLKQEAINKYGDKAAKLNAQQLKDQKASGLSLDDYLKKQAEQQSAQDKFNNAVEKLQSLLSGIVEGPIGQLIQGFAELINHSMILYPIVGAIAGLMAGKMVTAIFDFGKGIVKAIPKMLTLLGLSEAKAVAEITAAEAASFGLATIGIIAGIGMAVAAMNDAKASVPKSAGDIISPADGKTQVSTKEGGLFELSKNDDLLAGPGLAKKGNSSDTLAPKGMSIDMSPMVAAINEVKVAIDRLYSKDTSINLDGRKVGAGLVQTSYKLA
jgi:uncharacterized protein YdcH (DUF465 family)